MEVGHTYAPRKCGNLGIVPLDREVSECSEYAEVVSVVSIFPDVFPRKTPDRDRRLLQPDVEFIAPARLKGVAMWEEQTRSGLRTDRHTRCWREPGAR